MYPATISEKSINVFFRPNAILHRDTSSKNQLVAFAVWRWRCSFAVTTVEWNYSKSYRTMSESLYYKGPHVRVRLCKRVVNLMLLVLPPNLRRQ